MIVFPAIDIMDGRAVRLQKGERLRRTDYGDPRVIAKSFAAAGGEWLHIVDLSAAFDGQSGHGAVIKETVAAFNGKVQLGGGIRTMADITERIEAYGIARCILGTVAVENPALVEEACKRYPGQIACGIDAKNGVAQLRGWVRESGVTAVDLAGQMRDAGVTVVIYTDIDKDGMMQGPNLLQTAEMVEKTGLQIIGSGGVDSLQSLKALKEIGCYGAITGKALYEKAFSLEEALSI